MVRSFINILTLKGIVALIAASFSLSIHENGSSKKGYVHITGVCPVSMSKK
jgi:hypothetical protein